MRISILLLSVSLALPAHADPWYVDCAGRRIDLTEDHSRAAQSLRVQAELPARAMVFSLPGSERLAALDRGVIVKLTQPGPRPKSELLAGTGLTHQRPLDASGQMHLLRATGPGEALAGARALAGRADVAWAVPDFWVPVTWCHAPTDPYYQNQWHHWQASGAHMHTEEAWDLTTGAHQVVVAVLDTGVELNHPDFVPARLLPGYDFADDDRDPSPGPESIDAHGTACAGQIVAAMDNDTGGSGLCPGCSLLPIRLGFRGDFMSNDIAAFQFALDHGAWVASNSWGIGEATAAVIDMTPLVESIDALVQQGRGGLGSVVLFAAGNGTSNDGIAVPIGEHQLANLPGVMAVGGTGSDDGIVSYSNYGPNLSVVAPTGHSNRRHYPGIFTTDTLGDRGMSRDGKYWYDGTFGDGESPYEEPDPTGDYTAWMSGTSAATPNAAGVVALVLSVDQTLTGAEVRLIIEQTADKVDPSPESYDPDGRCDHYGFGRVNAGRAVRATSLGLTVAEGEECAEDINCVLGQCHKAFADDPYGLCAAPCAGDQDCGPDQACAQVAEGTACLPACAQHADCPTAEVCADACRQVPCAQAEDCPAGTACLPDGDQTTCQRACESDDACNPPALCLPALGGDLCQTLRCQGEDPCPQGAACALGGEHCIRPCGGDEECQAPEICIPGKGGDVCQARACESDATCPTGSVCGDSGLCTRSKPSGGCGTSGSSTHPLLVLFVLLTLLVPIRRPRTS